MKKRIKYETCLGYKEPNEPTVGCAENVRAGRMDCGMNHVRCCIQDTIGSRLVQDISIVIDKKEVGGLNQGKVKALQYSSNTPNHCRFKVSLQKD